MFIVQLFLHFFLLIIKWPYSHHSNQSSSNLHWTTENSVDGSRTWYQFMSLSFMLTNWKIISKKVYQYVVPGTYFFVNCLWCPMFLKSIKLKPVIYKDFFFIKNTYKKAWASSKIFLLHEPRLSKGGYLYK